MFLRRELERLVYGLAGLGGGVLPSEEGESKEEEEEEEDERDWEDS